MGYTMPVTFFALMALVLMLGYHIKSELLASGKGGNPATLKSIFQISRAASAGGRLVKLERLVMWALVALGLCTFPFAVLQVYQSFLKVVS